MQDKITISLIILFSTILTLIPSLIESHTHKELTKEFQAWASSFDKKYDSYEEYHYRFKLYLNNKRDVEAHNKLAQTGKYSYFLGMNQFADLTKKEFKHLFGRANLKFSESLKTNTTKCTGSISDTPNPPEEVNWTEQAVDKTVKIEGKCAANWAFSAVAAVEGLYASKLEKFIKFSDQQLIDCSTDYGNEGCGGGFMEQAYWYIIDEGLATEKSYPYVGIFQKCKYSQSQKVAKLGKCAQVPSQKYDKLLSAIVQQPVSVSVASEEFMLYERGVYNSDCSLDLDRGLLLVGYGKDGNDKYWLLKNFLGVAWGEKGYIRLKRTEEDGPGLCGIQLAASVPQNIS